MEFEKSQITITFNTWHQLWSVNSLPILAKLPRGEWKLYVRAFNVRDCGGIKLQVVSHHGAAVEKKVEQLCYRPVCEFCMDRSD